MKNNKITPQDREQIISRVNSGTPQKDIATEFCISKGRVSQIISASKEQPSPSDASLESVTPDNLYNQLTEISRQITETFSEKSDRWQVARNLKTKLANDNETLLKTDDAELKRITQGSMTATQRVIVWNENHTSLDAHLIDLYATQLAIFREYARRGHSLPFVG